MKNHFLKIASLAVGTILTYSMSNLNSAQAINNVSNISDIFLTAQTTKIPVNIEPNVVIDDGSQPNSKATNEATAIRQTLNKVPEKSNLESKFLPANSQTKFVNSKVGNLQLDSGIVLGVGLISVSRLFAKKRL
ncbi:MAG: hypothetical protein F6K40_15785 [Okeania sp. SIO3I5]|uniref:hypothetical protein n=1 Tax=Okeania sp. SIO3I5 TaxID=2607805 RepID=UPI0013BD1935|nr:hypothetical protein [Okeania sp. SIO3I5]NEQ37644.1 hypothetical protein [Okeania sp. SIO3I5]